MSRPTSVVLAVAAMCLPAVQPVFSQSVISAKSGLIHYAQGAVYVGDAAVITKAGQFPQINEKQELRTEAGRAEARAAPRLRGSRRPLRAESIRQCLECQRPDPRASGELTRRETI